MIVTLNPSRDPSLSLKHDEYIFDHPVFDSDAINAQSRLPEIQGKQNTCLQVHIGHMDFMKMD